MEETREQWAPRGDAGVFCRERNAKQPLDTVRSYTGFASSCLDTFCNGNNLIKNKLIKLGLWNLLQWVMIPTLEADVLAVTGGNPQDFQLLIESIYWGAIHVMLICGSYPTVASS